MKKFALITMVFILLAATAVPVFAGSGTNHGNDNGNGASVVGQGNGHGNNGDKEKNQNHGQNGDKNKGEHGNGKFKNQENTKWMYTPFFLQGTITAIDPGAETITIAVMHANAKVKGYIGQELVVATNDATQIFQITQGDGSTESVGASASTDTTAPGNGEDDGEPSNRISINFDQLEVGQMVAVHGRLVDTVYTARLITVYIRQPVEEPVGNTP